MKMSGWRQPVREDGPNHEENEARKAQPKGGKRKEQWGESKQGKGITERMAKGTQRVSETEMEMEYVLYVHKHAYIHHRNWRREGALGFPGRRSVCPIHSCIAHACQLIAVHRSESNPFQSLDLDGGRVARSATTYLQSLGARRRLDDGTRGRNKNRNLEVRNRGCGMCESLEFADV
ncbi:hypothetical protein N656DRAFT_245956 [Canariomyces notabilis]|uniref:Uncharacterized protein n=1 Tax=Canariomyces notabilis TaxID=2074819 RepID=A0AAN6TLD3_9PEZI|nr:hypothetical protein N656DRAFT_245956 [Canariomyces arenarius]